MSLHARNPLLSVPWWQYQKTTLVLGSFMMAVGWQGKL